MKIHQRVGCTMPIVPFLNLSASISAVSFLEIVSNYTVILLNNLLIDYVIIVSISKEHMCTVNISAYIKISVLLVSYYICITQIIIWMNRQTTVRVYWTEEESETTINPLLPFCKLSLAPYICPPSFILFSFKY